MAEYVYLMAGEDAIKVGVSNDPERRLGEVSDRLGPGARVVRVVECATRERAFELESGLHKVLAPFRLEGNGMGVECFAVRAQAVVEAFMDAVPREVPMWDRSRARHVLRARHVTWCAVRGRSEWRDTPAGKQYWLSRKEACEALGVSHRTLRRMAEHGRIERRRDASGMLYLIEGAQP